MQDTELYTTDAQGQNENPEDHIITCHHPDNGNGSFLLALTWGEKILLLPFHFKRFSEYILFLPQGLVCRF